MDFARHMTRIIDRLGEPVTVKIGAVQTPLQAVYSEPYTGLRIGNVLVDRADPTAVFKTAEFSATGAQPGDVVSARGKDQTIVSAKPLDGGLTECILRAF
jgi:hypothetical protein